MKITIRPKADEEIRKPEPIQKSAAVISAEYLEAVCKTKGITLSELFAERPDLYADHCRREDTVSTGARNIP